MHKDIPKVSGFYITWLTKLHLEGEVTQEEAETFTGMLCSRSKGDFKLATTFLELKQEEIHKRNNHGTSI
jgi:hypothetical protein